MQCHSVSNVVFVIIYSLFGSWSWPWTFTGRCLSNVVITELLVDGRCCLSLLPALTSHHNNVSCSGEVAVRTAVRALLPAEGSTARPMSETETVDFFSCGFFVRLLKQLGRQNKCLPVN